MTITSHLFPAPRIVRRLLSAATVGAVLILPGGCASGQGGQPPLPPARVDSARAADSARVDAARVDSLRLDSLRVDSTRIDAIRPDSVRADSTRDDLLRADSAGASSLRVDSLNVDWMRVDSARATPGLVDSLRDGSLRVDSLRVDSARAAPVGVDSAAVAPPVDSATIEQDRVDSVAASPARDPLWPVAGPEPLPGALLPHKRIVAYYGNPLSRRMGILGEVPPDSMLKRLDAEVAAWEAADPATPVQPALHLVTIVAQADAGPSGKYRALMSDSVIERVASWAERRGAIVFLDLQVGLSTLEDELPRIAKFLERPNFNLGIDPEFMMKDGSPPGKRIGHITAEDVNYAVRFLGEIVERHDLPPKVLVIHRFTNGMVRNSEDIELDPRVQIVMHMDGWGPPRLKRASYREYVYEQPVQFAGFKVFYKNDTRQGHPVMTPEEILTLFPRPLYIQYQ